MNKKYVLQEFMNLDYSDDLLTEDERAGNKEGIHLVVAGKIQCAEAKNGNGRIYPKPILEREVKNYTKLVKEGRAIGELDHPDSSVVELKNASHVMTEVWWKGNDVMGKMKILDTPAGKIAIDPSLKVALLWSRMTSSFFVSTSYRNPALLELFWWQRVKLKLTSLKLIESTEPLTTYSETTDVWCRLWCARF